MSRHRLWTAAVAAAAVIGLVGSGLVEREAARATDGGRANTGSAPAAQIVNPVLWEDLADIDIFRVGDTFYYSASTMHYSPGAPILRSFDLVNWEFAGILCRGWISDPSTT